VLASGVGVYAEAVAVAAAAATMRRATETTGETRDSGRRLITASRHAIVRGARGELARGRAARGTVRN
jgi:hypothetical protein